MNLNFINVKDRIVGQLIDYWAAYRQFCNRDQNYRLDVEVCFTEHALPDRTNVMIMGISDEIDPRDHPSVDLFLLDNNGESLEVSSDRFRDLMLYRSDCVMVCGSYLGPDHPLYDRIVSWNHNHTMTVDAMARAFYPQYHDLRIQRHVRDRTMIYCNGQSRAWRQHWMHLMDHECKIDVRNNLSSRVMPVLHCAWESDEDRMFREWLNCQAWVEHSGEDYEWCNPVAIGLEHQGRPKFGYILAAYTMLDLYYQYHCVLYPESSWINDQLFLTEKTFKCLAAGAIPWPISGAGTNRMMRDLGVLTAWNLLPPELQTWDDDRDHRARYQAQSRAVAWMAERPHIWQSSQADHIRTNNLHWFYCNNMNVRAAQTLDHILSSHDQAR